MPIPEYIAVREKIDAHLEVVASSCGDALTCRSGCTMCCEVELTLCAVEAENVRRALGRLGAHARAEIWGNRKRENACVMLDWRGNCAIYEERPFVCRTQGHAIVHESKVAWCTLNFTLRRPAPRETLDGDRIHLMLAVANRRYCETSGSSSEDRFSMRTLAEELDVRTENGRP